jgi:hypothetical protein
MVCPEFDRLDLARLVQVLLEVFRCLFGIRLSGSGSGRHIVMPSIPRNADNVGIV